MKIEDVERAMMLKEEIDRLNGEIRLMQKRKQYDATMPVHVSDDDTVYVEEDTKNKVLDVIIKARDARIKECMKELKAL